MATFPIIPGIKGDSWNTNNLTRQSGLEGVAIVALVVLPGYG